MPKPCESVTPKAHGDSSSQRGTTLLLEPSDAEEPLHYVQTYGEMARLSFNSSQGMARAVRRWSLPQMDTSCPRGKGGLGANCYV